jgi:hypothetical protein
MSHLVVFGCHSGPFFLFLSHSALTTHTNCIAWGMAQIMLSTCMTAAHVELKESIISSGIGVTLDRGLFGP